MNYSVFDLFSSDIDVKEVIKHTFPNLDLLPSKLKLFEFGDIRYSLLSLYEINISKISFHPNPVLFAVKSNLNFK